MVRWKRRGINNHTDNLQSGINSILLPEIIFSILVRVPVFDLLRVKTVCRQWFDIISSRDFAVASLEYWKFRPEIMFLDRNHLGYFLTSFNMETKRKHRLCLGKYVEEDVQIVSALDGLLLFLVTGPICRRLFICNPLTQKFKLLLYVPTSWNKGGPVYTLVFDCLQQNYKVIGFFYHSPDLCIDEKYCVLTLNNDEGRRRTRGDFRVPVWRNVENQFRHFSRLVFSSIAIGRTLYWVACTLTDKAAYLQTMDIVEEVFKEKIHLPCQPADLYCGTCQLLEMESRGSLSIAIPCSKSELGIWLLKPGENYEWIKQHNIILESVVGRPSNLDSFNDYRFEVLFSLHINDSNHMKLFIQLDKDLYTYNLKERDMTLVITDYSTCIYVPSLTIWEQLNSGNT